MAKVCFEEEKNLTGKDAFTWEIPNPELWSAEEPKLYDLMIEVYNAGGVLCELIPEKVGFRRFEMKDRIMTLNGKRIVFKGVNRHEFSSVSGRCVSEKELRKDLTVMKQNNINAVRTCHYPNTSLIYRLCDELGLYMIDETNLESHGAPGIRRRQRVIMTISCRITSRNGWIWCWTARIPCIRGTRTIRPS